MKAILATAFGSAEVLQYCEVPVPELPSPHHVRVRLAAAGVNPVDTKVRAKPGYFPDGMPMIPGCDGAGVVESVGAAVTRFRPGDEVYFCNGGLGDEPGCYAEFTTLHEDFCAAKPASLSMVEAAALPLVFITAWESLVERVNLQAGQTVLIHAGAGGVGHVAVQLARQFGARVAVTVSDEAKAALARELGAERIIPYREQDFVAATLDWTSGQARSPHPNPDGTTSHSTKPASGQVAGYLPPAGEGANESLRDFSSAGRGADVVFDTVGGETWLKSLHAARIGGKVVSLLSTAMSAADAQTARLRNLTLAYDLMLTPQVLRQHGERVRQRRILEQAARLVAAGQLRPVVSRTVPLAEAAEAHRLIERGGRVGKVVLKTNGSY
jgi:NADPH2:quinone reductase